jgi:hypothetical protein
MVSFDVTFDDVPNGSLSIPVLPDSPNIRAPPNTPADPSTATIDNPLHNVKVSDHVTS